MKKLNLDSIKSAEILTTSLLYLNSCEKQSYISLTNNWIIASNGKEFKECIYKWHEVTYPDVVELFQKFETNITTRVKVEVIVPTDDILNF